MKKSKRPTSKKLWRVVCTPSLAGKTYKTYMGAYRAVTRVYGSMFDLERLIEPINRSN